MHDSSSSVLIATLRGNLPQIKPFVVSFDKLSSVKPGTALHASTASWQAHVPMCCWAGAAALRQNA
jgi:hypothetical protein